MTFFASLAADRAPFVTLSADVTPPPPIPDDDDLAVLMLALSPDMYLRHADEEGEFLADSSSGGANRGTVVGTMAAWGVDADLPTPTNPERAITYGGTGSLTADPTPAGVVTYGIRCKPTQADIDNAACLFERAVSGNGAGYWGLRLLPGGALRMFMQTGAPPPPLETDYPEPPEWYQRTPGVEPPEQVPQVGTIERIGDARYVCEVAQSNVGGVLVNYFSPDALNGGWRRVAAPGGGLDPWGPGPYALDAEVLYEPDNTEWRNRRANNNQAFAPPVRRGGLHAPA